MLRRTLAALAAAVAVLAGLLVLPSSAAATSVPAAPVFGSQFHGMWSSYTDAQREQTLDTLAAHGAEWVRLDVSWSMLQPDGPGTYSTWGTGFVDRVVNMITARGMKPLVMLWMTPAWANGGKGQRALPDDPQHYAAAAKWAAAKWAGKVRAWEVWNEPNADAFMTGADPAAYGRLLQAAYPAFKAGDPTAPVLFGGTMYNDVDWIRQAYANGAKGSFDVMATHPYQAKADREPEYYDGTKWTMLHAKAVHELMVANGDGHKPIWFTEFGWSSHPNDGTEPNWNRGVTLEQQADYLVRSMKLISAEMPYVQNVFWYRDRNRSDSDPQKNNYGLLDLDLAPKPALLAIKAHLDATATEPTTEPVTEPTPEPTTEPVTEPTTEPTPEPTTEPVTEPTAGTPTTTVEYEVLTCPYSTTTTKVRVALCPPKIYKK